MTPDPVAAAAAEAQQGPDGAPREPADRGTSLCLSGGGFRATLFHLGAVRRLNELGVLATVSTIASVSGGSILNGLLASRWSRLTLGADGVYENFDAVIGDAARDFCGRDLRTPLLLGTRLNPLNWPALARDWFSVNGNFLAAAYGPLYRCSLGEVPPPAAGVPRFVFCATNVGSGACWHFHGGPNARMGDFYTGYAGAAHVRLAEAVAASSAFPPGFSPLRLDVPRGADFTRVDPWGEARPEPGKRRGTVDGSPPATVLLTDGGVYDNLGVEPVWNRFETLLVSDAGRPFETIDRCSPAAVPRLTRAAGISAEQVGAVRKRWLVDEFLGGRRRGALWAINTRLADFPLPDAKGYGEEAAWRLQRVRTDLDGFSEAEVRCLENHGYTLADSALRSRAKHLCAPSAREAAWPHPEWQAESKAAVALAASGRRRLLRDSIRFLTGRTG